MNEQTDTQTLIGSFSALADEVQNLIDRKTILEHKLRFAAEQYQYLADKYAPAAPEISETLANLQLPPNFERPTVSNSFVPLPKKGQSGCSQHQIAVLIRDGRRAAQQLSLHTEASGGSSKETSSGTAITMMSTMEQDFTIEGKRGLLECPFSAMREQEKPSREVKKDDLKLSEHQIGQLASTQQHVEAQIDGPAMSRRASCSPSANDLLCAGLTEDVVSQGPSSNGAAARCPIRFLNQHSPEEIAHYVETHKHDLPRSHAICLKRYNKNEEQIRKLDAKYGSLVNMITGLGQFHQPMLHQPTQEESVPIPNVERTAAHHHTSNERVKSWANDVSTSGMDDPDPFDGDNAGDNRPSRGVNNQSFNQAGHSIHDTGERDREHSSEREGRFDRPLKEVRLGESPSRPWGISVPIMSIPVQDIAPPQSPSAAPVHIPNPGRSRTAPKDSEPRKCPFDHSKITAGNGARGESMQHQTRRDNLSGIRPEASPARYATPERQPPSNAGREARPEQDAKPATQQPAPTFINSTPPHDAPKTWADSPQMVFTGPVFIGYSIDQAMQVMQRFQQGS